jgi:hypothetical protein
MMNLPSASKFFASQLATDLDGELTQSKPAKLPKLDMQAPFKLSTGRFRSIPMLFTDTTDVLNLASEFRVVCDEEFRSHLLAFKFKPNEEEAPQLISMLAEKAEESTWKGPKLADVINYTSVEELKELVSSSEEVEIPSATFCYVPAFVLTNKDAEWKMTKDSLEMIIDVLKTLKEHQGTHYKNGKCKRIPEYVASLLYYLIRHQREKDGKNRIETKEIVTSAILHSLFTREAGNGLAERFPVTRTVTQKSPEGATQDTPSPLPEDKTSSFVENLDEAMRLAQDTLDEGERISRGGDEDVDMEDVQMVEDEPEYQAFTTADICPKPGRKMKKRPVAPDSPEEDDDLLPDEDYRTITCMPASTKIQIVATGVENKFKKWNNWQRKTLLCAMTPDCESMARTPTSEFMELLKTQTGAHLAAHVEARESQLNMEIDTACMTNIMQGIIVVKRQNGKIRGFSNHAFPPASANCQPSSYDIAQEYDFHKSTDLSSEYKKLLTKQGKFHPKDTNELKNMVKNTSAMSKIIFGPGAYITKELGRFRQKLDLMDYEVEEMFATNSDFGGWFSDRMHDNITVYLAQALTGVSDMEKEYLDLKKMLMDIRKKDIPLLTPSKAASISNYDSGRSGGSNRDGKRRRDDNDDRSGSRNKGKGAPVENPEGKDTDYLRHTEHIKLFDGRNRKGLPAPKMNDGTVMCWSWNSKGLCNSNCGRARSHTRKDTDEADRWDTFVKDLRSRSNGKN